MMKHLKSLGLALAVVAGASPAFADDALFASPRVLTQTSGEAIYNGICVACHQKDGVGAFGAGYYPALANNENFAAADYSIYVILHGQKAMPPLKGVLNDEQIAEVVNYIRTTFNDYSEEPATAAQVAAARE